MYCLREVHYQGSILGSYCQCIVPPRVYLLQTTQRLALFDHLRHLHHSTASYRSVRYVCVYSLSVRLVYTLLAVCHHTSVLYIYTII